MAEAKRQIDSTIHKLKQALQTLQSKEKAERYRSQITLVQRRIQAFTLASELIDKEAQQNEEASS